MRERSHDTDNGKGGPLHRVGDNERYIENSKGGGECEHDDTYHHTNESRRDLHAYRVDLLCDLSCKKHHRREKNGGYKRQKRRQANGGKAWLDDEKCAKKPGEAGGEASWADRLVQKGVTQFQHDERKDEGDGQRVGKRQETVGGDHGGDGDGVRRGAQHDDNEHLPRHAKIALRGKNDGEGEKPLRHVSCKHHHDERGGERYVLCRRIAKRSQGAKS